MSVLVHNIKLYERVRSEFWNNCLWYQIDGYLREQKGFREELLFYIFNICEINPSRKYGSPNIKRVLFRKIQTPSWCVQTNPVRNFTYSLEKP